MKQLIYSLILALPFCAFGKKADPESGTIKGQVTTSDNKPASFVHVVLKGTNKGVMTEDNGSFLLNKVTPGTYQLEVSLVGYETLKQQVVVEKDKITAVAVQLTVSNTQLEEVTVTNARNKFADKTSEQVARMPLRNLENPQVYNVVDRQLIQEQMATERTELFRNIPGAVPNFSAGGSQGFSMRGFTTTIGMRNGMATSAIVPLNPIILERVEAIKGPAGTLFGSNRNVTFGGVYNYVTKKPFADFGAEVSLTGGSFAFSRLTADVNSPLNKDKTLLMRVNAGVQSEGSFQDQGFNKNITFAPTFTYLASDRLKFTIDAEFTRGNYTTTAFAIDSLKNTSYRNFKDLPLAYKSSLINNSIDISNGIDNIQFQMEYKISDQWKSQTNYLYSNGFYKHLYWTTITMITDSTFGRSVRNQTPETFGNTEFQQNFIGDFHIGSLRNRMVVGVDYNYNYNQLNRVTVNYDTVRLNKAQPVMNTDKINALSAQKGFVVTSTKTLNVSAYVSDAINITPELIAMASVRVDRYSTDGLYTQSTGLYANAYNQTSVSPKFGVVYQMLHNKLSLFGNYMNGFVNLGPLTQGDNIVMAKPQYGNQWEGGVKFALLSNKLNGGVSFYNIDITNATRDESIGGKKYTFQDGTQRSRGVEVELIANPVAGLNIVSGYAYNKNEYTKASAATQGKQVVFSPNNTINFWASYVITKGKTKGLGFGAGGNYVGESWFEATNSFKVPAYTLVNATVFFDQKTYRLSLKGNNLTGQQYWNNNGTAQKPVNFLASVAFKF
ncbi:iron complex outermembrane recepter protein [Filimonas lacunae]|uniref:Iron complex outermembrane recepter protein n=1 Tax=Filimonas lacunae TaxID=477680 RepID=A0A173MGU6_9BACT|nr:TonB-dependent receptor [Filimonas lacunae]BAV06651.1 ferrichrome-iron receptor [Filimonas lacunae]SIT27760.1 iron complex outermembrane recepter protein [Filimonas lacunae]